MLQSYEYLRECALFVTQENYKSYQELNVENINSLYFIIGNEQLYIIN